MFEKASDLPKKDPRRNEIAAQVWAARKLDRLGDKIANRSGLRYVQDLEGVENLFDYTRRLKSQAVLDIGAGSTRGVHELANSTLGDGLRFEATVLTRPVSIVANLGREFVRSTSAEVMRGIADESIGCVISVFSIAYSAEPNLVIKSIDRVLVPGGVLKARFLASTNLFRSEGEPNYSVEFHTALLELGYDVASSGDDRVLLAIKPVPGSSPPVSAEALMEEDSKTVISQMVLMGAV